MPNNCPFCGLFPSNLWVLADYCPEHYTQGFWAWLETRRRSVFTSDEIVADIGMPPEPNHLGALINAAARKGVIVPVGFAKSTRIEAHGRYIREWRIAA